MTRLICHEQKHYTDLKLGLINFVSQSQHAQVHLLADISFCCLIVTVMCHCYLSSSKIRKLFMSEFVYCNHHHELHFILNVCDAYFAIDLVYETSADLYKVNTISNPK